MNGRHMKNWYCIYTKPRYEGLVAGRLATHPDIGILNPKIRKRKYVRGKMREVVEELFPCYIFSRFDPLKYHHMVTYTRGVRRIVGDSAGRPYMVEEGIIDAIRSRLEDGFVHIEEPALVRCDHVVVREGPFMGLTGIFQKELKATDRVLILLNTLAYQANIEIDKALLARA